MKTFLDILNCCHPSIKFTSKYSQERIDFLDVETIKEDNRLLTHIFVESIDTNEYFHPTSCLIKKTIPYSHASRFNRICLENQFLYQSCSDLEVWLQHHGYNEKLVRQQILKARKDRRTELLCWEEVHKKKSVLNITYYPIFFKLTNILWGIHLLLTFLRIFQ